MLTVEHLATDDRVYRDDIQHKDHEGPDTLPDNAVIYRMRCYGDMHMFTSPPDSVWCLLANQHALFLSDTGGPIANEKSVSH